jgi:hypothetical protein
MVGMFAHFPAILGFSIFPLIDSIVSDGGNFVFLV